ncbi:hypothetical protein CFP56_015002 [Quercus suber]|uniref:Uncharacterized protein n=1 Tax=Quercus suber TaxID=58331 RepID=A0AAW0KRC8_QUESU
MWTTIISGRLPVWGVRLQVGYAVLTPPHIHLSAFAVMEIGNLCSVQERKLDLGVENDVGLGLVDTTIAIFANEAEASDVGGEDLFVATSSIRNPFKSINTHSTAIVHVFLLFLAKP